MKDIKIDDVLKTDPTLLAQIDQVTQLLEEEIGPSASAIRAEWSEIDRHDEKVLELTISDGTNESTVVFSRPGLTHMSLDSIRILLIRLWGDILQERSKKQMEKLMRQLQVFQEG
jgi:hypothetical protein